MLLLDTTSLPVAWIGLLCSVFSALKPFRSLRIWTTEKETPVRLMSGHHADVEVCRFHPNSNYIASGGADRCIRVWDISDGKCVRILTGHRKSITTMAWSPVNGRHLITGDIGKVFGFRPFDFQKSAIKNFKKVDKYCFGTFQRVTKLMIFSLPDSQLTSRKIRRHCFNLNIIR